MKRKWPTIRILLAGSAALLSCVDSSKSSDEQSSTSQLAIAPDFTEMELSTALSAEVPAVIKGQGEEALPSAGTIIIADTSLKRSDRQKAIEGCEIRRSVKNGLNIIREMAQEICYIEAGGKSFKPNGKYLVSYDEDGWKGDYGVWIDDTTAGRRRISFCANGSLRYIFDLEAANAGQAKGVVTRLNIAPDAASGEMWAVRATFDSGVTTPGRTELDIRGDYLTSYGHSHERLLLSYEKKGIAFVAESKKGETPLEDGSVEQWTSQSAALMAANIGSMAGRYSYGIKDSLEPAASGGYRAYFDGKGYVLSSSDSDAWKPGGPLYVGTHFLPRLPDWEKIALPADAWDCSGTTELTPEGSATHYARCDAMRVDWEEENCEDESIYTYSGEDAEIPEDQLAPADKIAWPR